VDKRQRHPPIGQDADVIIANEKDTLAQKSDIFPPLKIPATAFY
jgi:hypothetical protein